MWAGTYASLWLYLLDMFNQVMLPNKQDDQWTEPNPHLTTTSPRYWRAADVGFIQILS